ncbi:hypothetical protein BGZ46_008084 [Entomortierella lignicola]|nr:hypothetical protein BGZ46_008084 [Entomortierella lignicola]
MIISTPKIDDNNDSNTLTMNNTLLNAKITADTAFLDNDTNNTDTNSLTSSNTTTVSSTKSSRLRRKHAPSHGYISRVGFDTLSCKDTAEYAFTLSTKAEGWKRTKNTRTFLVGTDMNNYSAHALQWLVENMIEDGDEIVALYVVPMELRDSWYKGHQQGQDSTAHAEANKIISSIRERNVSDKKISIVVEIIVGVVRDTFQHMIKFYEPDMLVVGSRGRSNVKGILSGSVSRYCLNQCLVPVIVVRPERKLNKSKNKAKGIFRRRSSLSNFDQSNDYQPHPTQPIHMSTSDFDFRNSLTISRNSYAPHSALFPSATVHAGDRFPGRSQNNQSTTPLSSLFTPLQPNSGKFSATVPTPVAAPVPATTTAPTSVPASNPTTTTAAPKSTTITLPPQPMRSTMPPPPEGMIKMKKSLTTDGTGKESKGYGKSSGFRPFTVFAPFLSKSDKDKDKEKSKKKRNSQG